MSNVTNAEFYSLIFSITILLDYLHRYRYKSNANSIRFIIILLTTICISTINIFMSHATNNDDLRFYLLLINFLLSYIPPYMIYEYIETDYLKSDYLANNKLFIRVTFAIFCLLSVIVLFINHSTLYDVPTYLTGSKYYNKLLLFTLFPMVVLYMAYTHKILVEKEKGSNRLFLTIIFCIIGMVLELTFTSLSVFTAIYTGCAFLLYTYNFDSVISRDHLTGLYNRDILNNLMHERRNSKNHLAVYVIDLDRFKSINDNYGHAKGDEVLKNVSDILSSSVRKNDFVIRYGGDEFLVVAYISNIKDVDVIKNKINTKVMDYNIVHKIKIGLSTGAYVIDKNDKSTTLNKAIKIADKKMYVEKANKKKKSNFC